MSGRLQSSDGFWSPGKSGRLQSSRGFWSPGKSGRLQSSGGFLSPGMSGRLQSSDGFWSPGKSGRLQSSDGFWSPGKSCVCLALAILHTNYACCLCHNISVFVVAFDWKRFNMFLLCWVYVMALFLGDGGISRFVIFATSENQRRIIWVFAPTYGWYVHVSFSPFHENSELWIWNEIHALKFILHSLKCYCLISNDFSSFVSVVLPEVEGNSLNK